MRLPSEQRPRERTITANTAVTIHIRRAIESATARVLGLENFNLRYSPAPMRWSNKGRRLPLFGTFQTCRCNLTTPAARAGILMLLASHLGSRRSIQRQGRRVVIGQRMIQGSPDIFLGWGRLMQLTAVGTTMSDNLPT